MFPFDIYPEVELPGHVVFHAKMGTVKDRNGTDLTEAEILGRGGKNTQRSCTKMI